MSEPVGFYIDHQMTVANLPSSEARIYSPLAAKKVDSAAEIGLPVSIGRRRRRHACPITPQCRRGDQTDDSSVGRNAPLAIFAANTGGIGEVTCTET